MLLSIFPDRESVHKPLLEILIIVPQHGFEALLQEDNVFRHSFKLCLRLSPELRKLCLDAEQRSAGFGDVQVNFCLNYGGRDEIVKAAKAFASDVQAGKYQADDLNEDILSTYLYSADVPDPELIIRPSGELRTSNFLLWQSAYSEYVFLNVLWPDFGPADLDEAIRQYHQRNRRFGGV